MNSPKPSPFLWDLEEADMRVRWALGAELSVAHPASIWQFSSERKSERAGPQRTEGMSCTVGEGEGQDSLLAKAAACQVGYVSEFLEKRKSQLFVLTSGLKELGSVCRQERGVHHSVLQTNSACLFHLNLS